MLINNYIRMLHNDKGENPSTNNNKDFSNKINKPSKYLIFVGDLLWIEDINYVKILHKALNRRTPFYNYNNAFNTKINCLRKFNLEFT